MQRYTAHAYKNALHTDNADSGPTAHATQHMRNGSDEPRMQQCTCAHENVDSPERLSLKLYIAASGVALPPALSSATAMAEMDDMLADLEKDLGVAKATSPRENNASSAAASAPPLTRDQQAAASDALDILVEAAKKTGRLSSPTTSDDEEEMHLQAILQKTKAKSTDGKSTDGKVSSNVKRRNKNGTPRPRGGKRRAEQSRKWNGKGDAGQRNKFAMEISKKENWEEI